jgi:hypothetical protein
MLREDLAIQGQLTILKYDGTGELVEEITAHNDITLAGRNLVARLFNKESAGNVKRVTKMFLGGDGAAFDQADTALKKKVGETPVGTIEASEVLVELRKRVRLRLTGELAEGDCNGELREAGLFTEDDVMYNRVIFPTITKTNKFKLTLVWEITF